MITPPEPVIRMSVRPISTIATPCLKRPESRKIRKTAIRNPPVADRADLHQAGLAELSAGLRGWKAPDAWRQRAQKEYAGWNKTVDQHSGPTNAPLPSYGHVVGAINRKAAATDTVSFKTNIIRFGLNYKLGANMLGPISSRY